MTVPLGMMVMPSRIQRRSPVYSVTSGWALMTTPSPMRAFLSMMQRSMRQLRPTPDGADTVPLARRRPPSFCSPS